MMPSITSTQSTVQATADESAANTTVATQAKDVDKNMFLQLLIAQLRNQDPLKPSSGTEFIGQLAQMQQLEQSINAGKDIAAMRSGLDQFLALAGGVVPKSN